MFSVSFLPCYPSYGLQMRTAVGLTIDALLEKVAFRQAQFLSFVFNLKTTEYKLAMMAVELAQGLIVPDALPTEIKDLLNSIEALPSTRRSRLTNETDSELCRTIEELSLVAKSAQTICRRVVLLQMLSSSLSIDYDTLAKEPDPLQLLRRVLITKRTNKFVLAKEVITVYNIEDAVLSSYIYRECQKSLTLKDEEFDILGNFEQVVSLCKDATILGNRIFYSLKKDDEIQLETNQSQVLYNEVELCILAHECFSVACCMEGISHVLRYCHTLVEWLVKFDQFSMMIRLLTGIGRYSEMSFVFDALGEHDRFVLLFERGMEKVPHLKVALLDYFKKKKELSQLDLMFKFSFAMHREIAEMNVESAEEKIIEIAVSDDTTWPAGVDLNEARAALDMVMVDLADAAEAFVKAECPMRALECARKAELLALQVFYLSAQPACQAKDRSKRPTKIINLSPENRITWINNHKVFPEARLVAEAYQMQVAWHAPLFLNVVVDGNANYLRDFESRMQLTPDIMQRICDCYARYQRPSSAMASAMEGLLERFPDLLMRYRCAEKLNFKLAAKLKAAYPILEDLLKTNL